MILFSVCVCVRTADNSSNDGADYDNTKVVTEETVCKKLAKLNEIVHRHKTVKKIGYRKRRARLRAQRTKNRVYAEFSFHCCRRHSTQSFRSLSHTHTHPDPSTKDIANLRASRCFISALQREREREKNEEISLEVFSLRLFFLFLVMLSIVRRSLARHWAQWKFHRISKMKRHYKRRMRFSTLPGGWACLCSFSLLQLQRGNSSQLLHSLSLQHFPVVCSWCNRVEK